MKALRDLSGLQLDQTAPFTAQERARIGLRDDDEAGIILPVPPSAGRLSFKHEGRDPDHCYTYRDATGGVLGDIFRCNAYNGSGKHFQPATFWKGANGKPRKRIALTLRLDDEVGRTPGIAGAAAARADDGPRTGPRSRKGQTSEGALPDALRRAGVAADKNGTKRVKPR